VALEVGHVLLLENDYLELRKRNQWQRIKS
jgi:hypothetical protein